MLQLIAYWVAFNQALYDIEVSRSRFTIGPETYAAMAGRILSRIGLCPPTPDLSLN